MSTPRTHAALAAATLCFTHLNAQDTPSFQPFESIEGTIDIGYVHRWDADDACPVDLGVWVQQTYPFLPDEPMLLTINENDPCDIGGNTVQFVTHPRTDNQKSRPPDEIISGYEWTFDLFADSAAGAVFGAGLNADIDFTVNRPVRVTLHCTYYGDIHAAIGSIQTETYDPTDGQVIDYDHYDSDVLGPGTHRLSIRAHEAVNRNTVHESDAILWLRFEDAYCSPADVAEPFAFHDLNDITTFIDRFLAADPAADLTGDGILATDDIHSFAAHFLNGCIDPASP